MCIIINLRRNQKEKIKKEAFENDVNTSNQNKKRYAIEKKRKNQKKKDRQSEIKHKNNFQQIKKGKKKTKSDKIPNPQRLQTEQQPRTSQGSSANPFPR